MKNWVATLVVVALLSLLLAAPASAGPTKVCVSTVSGTNPGGHGVAVEVLCDSAQAVADRWTEAGFTEVTIT